MINLSLGINETKATDLYEHFEEEAWEALISKLSSYGIDTVLLDVCDAVEYKSHPEISLKNAWSRERVKKELARFREMGITVIPKMNFSARHDIWLGRYERMLSTPEYYEVCRDLIKELYEIFEHPEYIHIGMDEEDDEHYYGNGELVIYRRKNLFFKDLRFLMDVVKETGAKPWIWMDPLFVDAEKYKAEIGNDALISPWYYYGLYPEHFKPIEELKEHFLATYEDFKRLGMTYAEDHPFYVEFREKILPLAEDAGYEYFPCASRYFESWKNAEDLVRYFKEGVKAEKLHGFMTAPWMPVTMKCLETYEKNLADLAAAIKKYYS